MKEDRLERERRTIRVMIEIACRGRHGTREGLCAECEDLYAYALERIEKCPFHEDKPTCAKCPIHCYKREMREKVRQVMRYAGPRMLLYHPVLTVQHYVDQLTRGRKAAEVKKRGPESG